MISKSRVIKFLNPVRNVFNRIYSFILSAYLGKIIIVLNQIDHNILDMIFYFFVFNPLGDGIKEYYKVVSSQTMGKKLYWLKKIYEGEIDIIEKEIKSSLKINQSTLALVGNKDIFKIIYSLEKLIGDTRNPLIHSNYFLGYGNEYEWKLSYQRFHYNKKRDEFDNSPFSLKEAREYLEVVQMEHDKLMRLYFQIFHKMLKL